MSGRDQLQWAEVANLNRELRIDVGPGSVTIDPPRIDSILSCGLMSGRDQLQYEGVVQRVGDVAD